LNCRLLQVAGVGTETVESFLVVTSRRDDCVDVSTKQRLRAHLLLLFLSSSLGGHIFAGTFLLPAISVAQVGCAQRGVAGSCCSSFKKCCDIFEACRTS
jgi:hypothetical protein